MATQILQQAPAAIPFPTAIKPVSQGILAGLMELRRQRDALDAQIEAAESDVRAALDAGAAVEPGIFTARIETSERRSVAWKDVAMRLAERAGLNSAAYAANVLAHTKPTVSTRLIVEA